MPRTPEINTKKKAEAKQASGIFVCVCGADENSLPSGPSAETSGSHRGRSDKVLVDPHFYEYTKLKMLDHRCVKAEQE